MADYNNADWAFTIPYTNELTGGQKLAAIQEQQKLDLANKNALATQQEKNREKNATDISDLDKNKYNTGDQAIDAVATKQLQQLQQDAFQNHLGDDNANLQYYLQGKLSNISSWYNQAKDAYSTLNQSLIDYSKANPNVDYAKARQIAFNMMEHDYINPDGTLVPPENIKNTDIMGYLNSPQVRGQLANDASALPKYIQSFKPQEAAGSTYKNDKGVMNKYAYSLGVTPFSEPITDNTGKVVGVQLKKTDMNIGEDVNGNPINMPLIPDAEYKNMLANQQVETAINKLWGDAKPAIEAEFQKQTGKPIDPATEEYLLRNFLYNYIKNNNLDNHYFKLTEAQKEPKTTISNYFGGSNVPTINDAYHQISQKIVGLPYLQLNNLTPDVQEMIVNYANKLHPGTTAGSDAIKYSQDNMLVKKDENGNLAVYGVDGEHRKEQYAKGIGLTYLFPLNEVSANTPLNTSIKQKQEVLYKANTPKPKLF